MKITSYERSTGMGARHGTQIRLPADEIWPDDCWLFVSDMEGYGSRHVRRDKGFEVYEIDLDPAIKPAATDIRAYHRSNSGAVEINPGHECRGYTGQDVPVSEIR